MPPAVTPDQARTVRRETAEGQFLMSDFLGRHDRLDGEDGYQAYLVTQQAPLLRPHFHEVDQFQVVVGGRGRLGRDEVGVGVVHYSDGHTPYGPITTDDPDGLAYFTLRLDAATGLSYMPESRERTVRGGEHFTALATPEGAAASLLAETSRGAQAWAARLGPGQSLAPELVALTGRGYVVVLSGALTQDGRELPPRTLVPFADGAELATLQAGTEAATLAVVRFATAASVGGARPLGQQEPR
ncbi:hypothetical protein [Rhodococcus sp. X156]|uniref:hypothetical protein n=1 Tax=Rhodococcus sp. X156 TaxID=2499145 RepID=UPI000FDBFB05|nr:hypothetical protein [Rhodococcus sp. X156]